jgi:hypothetical protein
MASRSRSRYQNPLVRGNRTSRHKTLGVELNHDDFGTLGNHYVYEVCSDTTMPRPYTVDHGLSIEKTVVRPTVISGVYDHGPTSAWEPEHYNTYRFHPFSANVNLWAFQPFNADRYKTLALANASPYRAQVNVPLFLFELRELPDMIRQLGRVLLSRQSASDVAGGYLAYSFGWAPLVNDILKFFDLTKALEDRKAYFRRLESGTHVRRSLGETQVRAERIVDTTLGTAVNSKTVMRLTGQLTETQKVWYTLNAKLRQPGRMSPKDVHNLSARVLHGWTLNPANLWDAIPWSWLIDYFLNIGDWLEAVNGLAAMDVTRINIMCTSKQVVQYTPHSVLPGLTVQPGFVYRTRKLRVPYSNAIPLLAAQPVLTDHMHAILGSLSTVKLLKAYGVK